MKLKLFQMFLSITGFGVPFVLWGIFDDYHYLLLIPWYVLGMMQGILTTLEKQNNHD